MRSDGSIGETELVVVRAADEAALVAELDRLVAYLDRAPDVRLLDVAYTSSLSEGDSVIAFNVATVAALRDRMASAASRLRPGGVARIKDKTGTLYFRDHLLGGGRRSGETASGRQQENGGGKLAFVFPGAPAFYPDMLRELAVLFPECRGAFDELEEAFSGDGEFSPGSFIFPPAAYYRHDADVFRSGAYSQALVSTYAASIAQSRLLKKIGIEPDGVVGFAGGEYAATMCAGCFGAEPKRRDRVGFHAAIYRIVDKAVNHSGLPKTSMLAVMLPHGTDPVAFAGSVPAERVRLVLDYSQRRKVYAVEPEFEAEATAAFAAAGARVVKLELERPFNTPDCESMVTVVKKFVKATFGRDPEKDIYSCATAEKLPAKIRAVRNDLAERWRGPICFRDTISAMYADGYRVFLEVGAQNELTTAIGEILRGRDHAAIALDTCNRGSIAQLQRALAMLIALGGEAYLSPLYVRRRARKLDFGAKISPEVRRDSEMRLSHVLPRLSLLGESDVLSGANFLQEAKGRRKVAERSAAAARANARRQRQFDFGASNPLVSDADVVAQTPGVTLQIVKKFTFGDTPLFADFALGSSQLSYSDPNLRGLVCLTMPVGAELIAETARMLVPNRELVAIENFVCLKQAAFEDGSLRLQLTAERVASSVPDTITVAVSIRGVKDGADDFTVPIMDAVCVLAESLPAPAPMSVARMVRPRPVHWSGREIYPLRVGCGRRLRGIRFVEAWSETGLNYELEVPTMEGAVAVTRFPLWVADPVTLGVVTSGFQLWRSHERFAGSFSYPFRVRRIQFRAAPPKEGTALRCYMRLEGVTNESHLVTFTVTDGDGRALLEISGWEERTKHVPLAYHNLLMQPATAFVSEELDASMLGAPATEIASAIFTDIPYRFLNDDDALWLRMLSRIALSSIERGDYKSMPGSVDRATEWLFGRIAAKESVRRYLSKYFQARWSDADVNVMRDMRGKPSASGDWSEYLPEVPDIAIAHTAEYVIAVTAAHAKIGVDVEKCGRLITEEFSSHVFSEDEFELAKSSLDSAEAMLRFWCAKEAVSKALGCGIIYSPREINVAAHDADTGNVKVRLNGEWERAFPAFRGRDIEVITRIHRNHILAFCYIPLALFG